MITKLKACRNKACAKKFMPFKPLQHACSIDCAVIVGREKEIAKTAKVDRLDRKVRKAALMTKADYAKLAQTAVNAFVRARDSELPCISCGRHHGGQYHAGHLLSVGAHPELRFEPLNIHKQCKPCNVDLHGNVLNYEVNLIAKVGAEVVAWLRGPHDAKHYTIDDLKKIRAEYKEKLKQFH